MRAIMGVPQKDSMNSRQRQAHICLFPAERWAWRLRGQDATRQPAGRRRYGYSLQTGFDAGAGVEIVTESVSDEVEGQHGEHDGGGREEDESGGIEERA